MPSGGIKSALLRRVLKATLVVGILRVIWHTPLLAYDAVPSYDFLFGIFALQIIFTWLYNGSGQTC
jgi:hypothetical protein